MRQFNKIRGFSIIEVAVAIAVLLLVLGGVTVVFVGGAKAARKTQQQAVAYNLVRGVLEDYSNWTRLDGLDGVTNGIVTNGTYALAPFTLNNISYTRSLMISSGPINATYVKVLNTTINWSDGSSPRTISVSTLKAFY